MGHSMYTQIVVKITVNLNFLITSFQLTTIERPGPIAFFGHCI